MTNPHRLIPSTLSDALSNVGAGARPRALRATSVVLCALGLLGAVACGDNTGDDVIQPSRSGSEEREPTPVTRAGGNDSVDEDGPAVAGGLTDDDDESGLDDEDEITGRSGGTRSTGGGGGGRRRTNDNDDDEEIESDAGVVDAGDAGVIIIEEDGGVVVEEDAGVVVEDAGVVDAG